MEKLKDNLNNLYH